MKFNGWKNYETWNVSLWMQNDEGLHHIAKQCDNYNDFTNAMRILHIPETPDQVAWNDSILDVTSLDQMLKEMRG